MKRTLMLAVVLLLAVHSAHSFRQQGPPRPPPRDVFSASSESDSSMSSSEEASFERFVEQKKRVQPDDFVKMQQVQQQKKQQQPKPQEEEEKKPRFFDRPSSEELESYDKKVRQQNKNVKPKDFPSIIEEHPIQGPVDSEIIRPKPRKGGNLDDTDEKAFLATLGQIYLEKMDEERERQFESERYPGPMGPMMPAGPPMDFDYFFVPVEDDVPKQANNNGNNNVHVNVNHVQVNSNVLHVPQKEEKKERLHEEPAPIVPAYHMSEPVSQTKYFYLNFNMTDVVLVGAIVAVFLFGIKKVYSRCAAKKLAPELPTTLPPTYTPSHVVVETTSKKLAPQ